QQDRGGNEAFDIYLEPPSGGAIANLTGTNDVSETNPLFSPDGSKMVVGWKPTKGSVTDIALIDVATKAVRKLTHEKNPTRSWTPVAWSRDGGAIIANRFNPDGTIGEIERIDLGTGRIDNLTPNTKAANQASSLSPDGKTVLLASNEKGGHNNVALLDVATKTLTWITDLKWEASSEDFSPDGKWITYSVNEDGRQQVYLAPVAGGAPRQLAVPAGLNSGTGSPSAFSPRGDRLLLRHQ